MRADRRTDGHTDMTIMIVDIRTVANPHNNYDFPLTYDAHWTFVTAVSIQQNVVVISEW
jgi:hypothetical protein